MAKDRHPHDREIHTEPTASGRDEKIVRFQPRPKPRPGPERTAPPDGDGPAPDPGPAAA
jgi:hypothetical protein